MAKRTSKNTAKKTGKKIARKAIGDVESGGGEAIRPPAPTPMGDLLGHERAVATLMNALGAERLHHAWIFSGPEGVGKKTAAVAFASLLLDPSTGPNLTGQLEADPDSPVQTLLRAGTHPDLRLVIKELARFSEDATLRNRKLTSIPVDVVREHLIRPAALAGSMPGGRASKVFIIDEAELLAGAAQNAILKTLEEPPEGTVVILLTASEDRLLPTIRSRCQRVRFGTLDDRAMASWMERPEAGPIRALPEHERAWLSQFAAGAPGAMLRAAEAGLAAWHGLLEPMLRTVEGGRHDANLATRMHKLAQERAEVVANADKRASKEAANKQAADDMLRLIASRWRCELQAAAARGDNDRAEAVADTLDFVTDCRRHADSNVNLLFAFERLVSMAADRFAGRAHVGV
ncbi:MAG: AAA family ATPase [Phycisphaerales bacterium]|nr:MAG: AAA family ATPase [Phycisphaerales bacterium]